MRKQKVNHKYNKQMSPQSLIKAHIIQLITLIIKLTKQIYKTTHPYLHKNTSNHPTKTLATKENTPNLIQNKSNNLNNNLAIKEKKHNNPFSRTLRHFKKHSPLNLVNFIKKNNITLSPKQRHSAHKKQQKDTNQKPSLQNQNSHQKKSQEKPINQQTTSKFHPTTRRVELFVSKRAHSTAIITH